MYDNLAIWLMDFIGVNKGMRPPASIITSPPLIITAESRQLLIHNRSLMTHPFNETGHTKSPNVNDYVLWKDTREDRISHWKLVSIVWHVWISGCTCRQSLRPTIRGNSQAKTLTARQFKNNIICLKSDYVSWNWGGLWEDLITRRFGKTEVPSMVCLQIRR